MEIAWGAWGRIKGYICFGEQSLKLSNLTGQIWPDLANFTLGFLIKVLLKNKACNWIPEQVHSSETSSKEETMQTFDSFLQYLQERFHQSSFSSNSQEQMCEERRCFPSYRRTSKSTEEEVKRVLKTFGW